jgi:hypothetical protein
VNPLVPSGTARLVPSGTGGSCHREPKSWASPSQRKQTHDPNLDSNNGSNLVAVEQDRTRNNRLSGCPLIAAHVAEGEGTRVITGHLRNRYAVARPSDRELWGRVFEARSPQPLAQFARLIHVKPALRSRFKAPASKMLRIRLEPDFPSEAGGRS